MEGRMKTISSHKNNKIKMGIIPGHFATNHSHINYYVDLTTIKKKSWQVMKNKIQSKL